MVFQALADVAPGARITLHGQPDPWATGPSPAVTDAVFGAEFEVGAGRVGAVLVAKGSENIAKLRLLHVEPSARGLGIAKRLVAECIRFARQAGYQKMTLWTQSNLHAARHIYRQAGFQVVREERHHSFGKDLTAETWELDFTTKTL